MAGRIQKDRQFPKLIELIKSNDLGNDILMPGYVSDEDLLELYALSNIFLFLSLYEGFGLPVLEAMATGTPVVASNRSSIPEVMGNLGEQVDPENIAMITAAVIRILENNDHAQELGELGRRQAHGYSWETTGKLTLTAYEEFSNSNLLVPGGLYAS